MKRLLDARLVGLEVAGRDQRPGLGFIDVHRRRRDFAEPIARIRRGFGRRPGAGRAPESVFITSEQAISRVARSWRSAAGLPIEHADSKARPSDAICANARGSSAARSMRQA